MASSANPDPWPDLSELGGADACAALLKVNAQMFAAAPVRDRDSIETFEALALGLLPKASGPMLNDIAHVLASCPDTPPSVLAYLRRHAADPHERSGRATTIPQRNASGLATAEGRAHLASQPHLDAVTIDRILVLHEASSEDRIAANPAFSPKAAGFHRLVRRALDRPALAHVLLQRDDLTALQEACLYLAADKERRRLIRERLARMTAPVPSATLDLPKHDRDALLASAAEGDIARFESLLTEAFGFPVSTEWRVLQIGRHLLLPLALKALGFPRKDAMRILLALHPALSYPLSALREKLREMRDVPGEVAMLLVEAILGAKSLSADDRAS